jgi:hypothetical protein
VVYEAVKGRVKECNLEEKLKMRGRLEVMPDAMGCQ